MEKFHKLNSEGQSHLHKNRRMGQCIHSFKTYQIVLCTVVKKNPGYVEKRSQGTMRPRPSCWSGWGGGRTKCTGHFPALVEWWA